ncbi:glycosyltransferase [Lysinibacillus sp. NPDC097231]|uniref:glycosyltransferase n=1 Tax=Lysinibacillus sp. NPDC097231 TaxID=3364142 RepID=UPI0037FB5997
MKILFVAQNFQMGGIQKALINTLKEVSSSDEYEIDVFTFGKGVFMKDIPPTVNVMVGSLLLQLIATPFAEVKKEKNLLYIVLRIMCMIIVRIIGSTRLYSILLKKHRLDERYHIAISYFNDVPGNYFNQGTNLFVDNFVKADKKFAWIHTDPIEAAFDYETCVNVYKNFDRLLCVSKACKQKMIDFIPQYKHKIQVVYNFFPINEINEQALQYTPFTKGTTDIVSVGRVDNFTKRFDLIPQLCKLLKDSSICDFRWRVLGDGPDLLSNKKLAVTLGVDDVIEFIGQCDNPYPYIKQSDVLILTSAFEGYPMVIGEALILETPVITTNFAAASEQISDGHNGFITGRHLEDIYPVVASVIENKDILQMMKQYLAENHYTNQKAYEQLVLEFVNND